MNQKIFVSAFVAGAAVGILAAVLQFAFVIPLLLEGELYESGVRQHFADGVAESLSEHPALGLDFARHGLTVAFNLITWIGFALILTALMAIGAQRGSDINVKSGAIWGAMAFFAVQLAPAAGLAPELPGTAAAEVSARYMWWAATILSAGAAIAILAFRPSAIAVLIAAVLLLAPHIYGAPALDRHFGVAPPELAAHFVTRSLAVAAVCWISLGAIAGWLWSRD